MIGDRIEANVLCIKMIPKADDALLARLNLDRRMGSLGIITADSDDVAYAALDEATKKANVTVAYARSMYAGSANANTKLAGEFVGILAGSDPEEVRSGLQAAADYINSQACFYSASEDDKVIYFAHCISSTGSYLSASAGVKAGTAMAYLIAPPLEAMMGLDAALKAAEVQLKVWYGPPTETNFAGGLLTGEQAACKAACEAFAAAVIETAQNPLAY